MRYVLGSRASIGGVLGSGRGGAAAAWYLAGGVSAANCVAAYQPIGAASLAASYTNLANPGTFDAAPGTAPTWATATGWTFNGSSQYLTTGIAPALTWTVIVKFSDATAGARWIYGVYQFAGDGFFAILARFTDGKTYFYRGTQFLGAAGAAAGGTLAIAGTTAYRDGSSVGTITDAGTAPSSRALVIGANNLAGTVRDFFDGKIQAVAIYNTTLTAPQVAAISAAMAAL